MRASATLASIAAEMWDERCSRDWYTASKAGRRVDRLVAGTLRDAEAVAARADEFSARLDAVESAALDRTERLTLAFLKHMARIDADEPANWLHGFAVTPYMFMGMNMLPGMVFAPIDLNVAQERERYLTLLDDLVGMVYAHTERLDAQAAVGWRIARPALPGTRVGLEAVGKAVCTAVVPSEDRADPAMRDRIKAIVDDQLAPAFADLRGRLDADYEASAPDRVGLCHLPGGDEAYRRWMRFNVGMEADPAEVHEIGKREVAALAARMEGLRRDAFGHDGDEASFHKRLREDPRAKAASPEALEALYNGHLAAMEAKLGTDLIRRPKAAYKVQRVAPALEAGMTFGYYNPPETAGDDGIFFYSGANLENRMHLNAASLIFHEILPGHHVHITRQSENDDVPALRRETFPIAGFNEGWAEYSADLGEELGLYSDPYDLYGLLSHQRFVAQRLVVDTGLNALGWTLEDARAYMAANTLEGPEQIASELVRYAVDLPAQALCYRLGFIKFRELRTKAEQQLGERFDLAGWHEAVLSQGTLPLDVLETSLDEWIEERRAA